MELAIEQELAAPPVAVWRALTDPAELAAWFWPARLAPTVEADASPGGGYRIASDVDGMALGGAYRAIAPLERLAFTWGWDGDPDNETLVTCDLAPDGERTRLSVRHEGFRTTEDRDNHVTGWTDCLARLKEHVAAA